MLKNVYWRQYPIDLLSDDKMACVEDMLPDEVKHLPYMIYIAALKICDENGVFDLDDGVILARLVRYKNVKTVIDIVNMMRQRKILYRLFDNSTLCGIVDWTYADKSSLTIEERRKRVAEKIKKEQARSASEKDFTLPGEEQPAPETQTAPQAGDFSCPENDKKAESVVIDGMDDKNAKNVDTIQYSTVQDNKTVQTNIQNNTDNTNTHTQQQFSGSGQLVSPPPENCQNRNAVGENNIQTQNTENPNIPTADDSSAGVDVSSLAEQALREAKKDVEETGQASLVGYLNDFFVKNCYGYDKSKSAGAINQLAGKILELSDDVNPPGTVAGVLCSEFKKMCEGQRGTHWKDMPVLPARMVNPNVWAVLCQHAGKILATANNQEKFWHAAQKAQEEYEKEKALVGDELAKEYLKYNIDPADPDAAKKIIIAKSQEQAAQQKADDEEFEIF